MKEPTYEELKEMEEAKHQKTIADSLTAHAKLPQWVRDTGDLRVLGLELWHCAQDKRYPLMKQKIDKARAILDRLEDWCDR